MLRDVIGDFLDSVTEREFDGPLLALLTAKGFHNIHFLHGSFEFGKDFIAQGKKAKYRNTGDGDPKEWITHQYALQSKAGNLTLGAWQEVRLQLDSARLTAVSHPSFDDDLERTGVLITTGRLRGAATAEAQSYRSQEQRWNRPDIEVWDRETLVEWMTESPDSGLTGLTEGALLALLGAIDQHSVSYADIERYGRNWLPPIAGSLEAATTSPTTTRRVRMRAAIESAVIVNRLRSNGRLDLAALAALNLLRAGWAHELAEPTSTNRQERPQLCSSAIGMFAETVKQLADQVLPIAADPRGMLAALRVHAIDFPAYHIACTRIAELIGLLCLLETCDGLAEHVKPDNSHKAILADLLENQPGCAHPASDEHAVSLIAPAIAAARMSVESAKRYITRCTVWLADRHDRNQGSIGLAPVGSTPSEEIQQLLGGIHEDGPGERRGSYTATALIDLAATTMLPNFYADVLNELLAAQMIPELRIAEEAAAHWRRDAPGVQFNPSVNYSEPFPADGNAAAHFLTVSPIPAWDSLALSSVVRDRHPVAAMREMAAHKPDALPLAER